MKFHFSTARRNKNKCGQPAIVAHEKQSPIQQYINYPPVSDTPNFILHKLTIYKQNRVKEMEEKFSHSLMLMVTG
jgi:hypothetical protein